VKKAEQYTNDNKRPNIHTALHYTMMGQEYALPSDCNEISELTSILNIHAHILYK
jgi:hypothetical protein